MNKTKKKIPIFPLLMVLYFLAGAIAIFVLLGKLWTYAEEYEASRPDKAVTPFMEQINATLWNDQMALALDDYNKDFITPEQLQSFVAEMLSGGISCARTASSGEDVIKYKLLSNGESFGSFTLVPDESKADQIEYGLLPWKLESHEYSFGDIFSSVEVTVPSNYSVKINGISVGESYVSESDIHFELLESYYGTYSGLPTMQRFKVDKLIGQPEVKIFDEKGNEVTVDPDLGDEQFLRECDEAKWADLADYAERFTKRYIRYTSGIGENPQEAYESLIGFLVPGSELDQRMIKAQDGLSWARGYSFSVDNVEVHKIVSFGGGIYFCDYSATFTVSTSTGIDTSTNNYRIIIKETDGDKRTASLDTYK